MLELILAAVMALHPGQTYAQHKDAKAIQSDSPRQVGPTFVVEATPPPEAHPCPRRGYAKDEDEVCRQTLATEAQVRIAKKPIRQTWVLIIVGIVQSAALILTLLEIAKTTRAANANAETAAAALKLSRDEFISTHRPRLRVRNIALHTIDGSHVDNAPSLVKPGDRITGQFYAANIGDTNASIEEAFFMIFIAKRPLPMERPYEGLDGNIAPIQKIASPGGAVTFIFDCVLATDVYEHGQNVDWRTEGSLYAMGWVEYVDDSESRRRTTFCRLFNRESRRFALPNMPDPDYEAEE